jgi:ankyrin repeat protein
MGDMMADIDKEFEIAIQTKNIDKLTELAEKHGKELAGLVRSRSVVLFEAIQAGNQELAIFLVKHGASAEVENGAGHTPLNEASLKNQFRVMRTLLENGANLEARNQYGMTPLMYSSMSGRVESVKFLIGRGADIEASGKSGRTSVFLAAWNRHMEVVEILAENGADTLARDSFGKRIMDYVNDEKEIKVLDEVFEKARTKRESGSVACTIESAIRIGKDGLKEANNILVQLKRVGGPLKTKILTMK